MDRTEASETHSFEGQASEGQAFEAERPRLVGLATRVLADAAEAQDVVQQAWLRLHGTETPIENLPAWLTTVTTRLCLDRLRARTPVPVDEIDVVETAPDPAEEVALADSVGVALQVVLDRLTPNERVAFVLHDTFGFEFTTIAGVLDTSPTAAKAGLPGPGEGPAARQRGHVQRLRALDRARLRGPRGAGIGCARSGPVAELPEAPARTACDRGAQQPPDPAGAQESLARSRARISTSEEVRRASRRTDMGCDGVIRRAPAHDQRHGYTCLPNSSSSRRDPESGAIAPGRAERETPCPHLS